jgi:hypothetical protein
VGFEVGLEAIDRICVDRAGRVGERRKLHVAGLGPVVDHVRRVQHFAQRGQYTLGIGTQAVGAQGQQIVQVDLEGRQPRLRKP